MSTTPRTIDRMTRLTETDAMKPLERILVVSNTDWFVANFMLPFLQCHQARGISVCAMTPFGPHLPRLKAAAIRWRSLPLSRRRVGLFGAPGTIASLRAAYREERPDLVHHSTALPVILGTLAARSGPGPSIVNAVPGLGHYFGGASMGSRPARALLRVAFRWAARQRGTAMIFQQEDDREEILGPLRSGEIRDPIIPGWGIDLKAFSPRGESPSPPIVILPARMLWTKGVEDFVRAARQCRKEYPARFVLVGAPDPGNPGSIPEDQLRTWQAEGDGEWWGHRGDMPEVLSMASIVVLPTRYREGVPQSLIEASAMQIPIVATDVPGCREVVEPGVNGILVPPGDPDRLAETVLRLLPDPSERVRMGSRGRPLVAGKFDVARIFASYVEVYKRLGFQVSGQDGS